jgi:hypothetical protein
VGGSARRRSSCPIGVANNTADGRVARSPEKACFFKGPKLRRGTTRFFSKKLGIIMNRVE